VGVSVSQCQDATRPTLSFEELGLVQPGSTNTLSAVWDQPNHQFVFGLNNNSPVALTYNVPDSFPLGLADKSFFVFGFVSHCTTTPRPFTSMDAFFGNVYAHP